MLGVQVQVSGAGAGVGWAAVGWAGAAMRVSGGSKWVSVCDVAGQGLYHSEISISSNFASSNISRSRYNLESSRPCKGVFPLSSDTR